jgi:L-lactate dehydrogenase complex protein LldG
MGGSVAVPSEGVALDEFVRARFAQARVICSATPEVAGTRSISTVRDPAELEDVDVGVVRAAFGVAETGSVWLSEREFGVNVLGFLSQHLVVLLDPRTIVPDLHHAYRHPGFHDARYAVFMTGPSATADIEGVLVRGAQGIRTLTVIPVAAAATGSATPARRSS